MEKHDRLIVNIKGDALAYTGGYPSKSTYVIKHDNDRKIHNIVTEDEVITVANKNIKVEVYRDGRVNVTSHQQEGREKI